MIGCRNVGIVIRCIFIRQTVLEKRDDGQWLETVTVIGERALPPDVLSCLHHTFSGFSILRAGYFQSPEIASAYAIELERLPGSTILETLISPTGEVLKQTEKAARKSG